MNNQIQQRSIKPARTQARIISFPGVVQQAVPVSKACYFKIALPLENGIRFLDHREISYCEAQGNYTNIVLENGDTILISKTLKWLESRLPRQEFFRSHGSYIVALSNISFLGRTSAKLDNGLEVSVSRRKRDALLQRLQ